MRFAMGFCHNFLDNTTRKPPNTTVLDIINQKKLYLIVCFGIQIANYIFRGRIKLLILIK